jgi:NhaA family Na+:H+ antiporter
LPIVAAAGGMVVPAALYLVFNAGTEASRGWGVPMATDIAFSLGVLALLGSRVPLSLKVFLAAFAIVDDMGAVAVIAIFYTESISFVHLGIAAALLVVLMAANVLGVRNPGTYALVGVVIWIAFLQSGVHATVAGIAVAATIPLRVRIDTDEFLGKGRRLLDEFASYREPVRRGRVIMHHIGQRSALSELSNISRQVESPLQRIEHAVHPWVAFGIMPLFALANAGVAVTSGIGEILTGSITLGVLAGLVVGKPIGIVLFSFIAIKLGIASMPDQVSWRQMVGVGFLGGIGFTMSIFISGLAFTTPFFVEESKVGILLASVVAGAIGFFILRSSAKAGQYQTEGRSAH